LFVIIVVSPYHLTTREPAALAAMLLADRVVTMLPAPLEGKAWGDVRGAAVRVPRYLEFMQSWQWTVPLWREGVIASGIEGDEAASRLRSVCERIDRDPGLAPLRLLMKPDLFEDHERYLDSLARDLLKAGPDPGITVPVAAGLDAFAMQHGVMVARSEPKSVVQKAEAELGRQVFAAAVPVLLQADAERILEARELLSKELGELRAAMDRASELARETPNGEKLKGLLAGPVKKYADGFEAEREELLSAAEADDVRVVEGTVMLTGMLLPPDCVFASSLRAMKAMGPMLTAMEEHGNGMRELPGKVGKPVEVMSLYVRVLGRPALARR
jgi:hypothetical protein